MLLQSDPPVHLAYCQNIHPGETWRENLAAIRRYAEAVKVCLAPKQKFGLGLRLGWRAAQALAKEPALAAFRRYLDRKGMYVFTINGFPYGRFHGTAVKEGVYQPDWRDRRRLTYTAQLGRLLASLLPSGTEGSISTAPVGYEAAFSEDAIRKAATLLGRCAWILEKTARQTGRSVRLALEPEPDCLLDRTADTISFFEGALDRWGVQAIRTVAGCRRAEAAEILRRRIGVCLDVCHVALAFESPAAALARLRRAGIAVVKLQVSAAVKTKHPMTTRAAASRLKSFDDGIYLHQVRRRDSAGCMATFRDLPALLESELAERACFEWRAHAHVPLYWKGASGLISTRDLIDPALLAAMGDGDAPHIEIETYSYHVLPTALQARSVVEHLCREYRWFLTRWDAWKRSQAGSRDQSRSRPVSSSSVRPR